MFQIGRRGKPGEKKVTNVDGVNIKSKHQLGLAVDCAFVVDGQVKWDVPDSWWKAFGALAVAVGLVWGGNWKSFVDRPHVELAEIP